MTAYHDADNITSFLKMFHQISFFSSKGLEGSWGFIGTSLGVNHQKLAYTTRVC